MSISLQIGSDSFSLQAEGRDGSKSLSVKGLPVCDSKSRSLSKRRRQPPTIRDSNSLPDMDLAMIPQILRNVSLQRE